MNILAATIVGLIAVIIAVATERLLRQYCRKIKDDLARMEAAQNALKAQQQLIDRILDNDNIPTGVKVFIIDVSEVIPNQEIAYRISDWIDAGMRASDIGADPETDQFFDDLRTLSKSNQEAFELATSALRGAFVTMMLQWPTTTRCMQRLVYRFAVESTTDVAKSAAAVRRVARRDHWIDADPLPI